MDQGVWLTAVQVIAVRHPKAKQHESIEAEAEGGVLRTVAQREEATNEHPAEYAGGEGDAFLTLDCQVRSFLQA
jgi:hypothetical protein